MARQKGIIQIEGTVGNLVFKRDGIVSQKGGGSQDTFRNSPSMERTRENASEFGRAGSAGKVLRLSLRQVLQNTSDRYMVSRLTKKMREIIATDETNDRGQRGILDGEVELLRGFEFNENARLGTVAFNAYTPDIQRTSGVNKISLADFVPSRDLVGPSGTTHLRFVAGIASVDFEAATFETKYTETSFLTYSTTSVAAQDLALPLTASSTHPIIMVLGVEFYQDVNGKKYPLNNGAYNGLAVVAVDSGV